MSDKHCLAGTQRNKKAACRHRAGTGGKTAQRSTLGTSSAAPAERLKLPGSRAPGKPQNQTKDVLACERTIPQVCLLHPRQLCSVFDGLGQGDCRTGGWWVVHYLISQVGTHAAVMALQPNFLSLYSTRRAGATTRSCHSQASWCSCPHPTHLGWPSPAPPQAAAAPRHRSRSRRRCRCRRCCRARACGCRRPPWPPRRPPPPGPPA
jgi:hypothetical protein